MGFLLDFETFVVSVMMMLEMIMVVMTMLLSL